MNLDDMPFGSRYGSTRSAVFQGGVIHPNLDAIRPDQRLEVGAPMLEATLGGRRVVLARPEYATSGRPYGYTVPLTASRMRRARDLVYDRASATYEPSALDGVVDSILAVKGLEKTSPTFKQLLVELAGRLGVDVDHLATVMAFESGGTFSPFIKNPSSGATGLIQFMPLRATTNPPMTKEAREIATYGATLAELVTMTAEEQLINVEHYLRSFTGKLHTLDDTYLSVFYPKAIGKPTEWVFPDRVYVQNAGFDLDHNGEITVGEISAKVHVVADAAQGRRLDVAGGPVTPPVLATSNRPIALVVAAVVGWYGYRWWSQAKKTTRR